MAIPKEILAVPRPKNTFVVQYGKNHDLYAVRKNIGCRYDKGRHIPIKGPTIGHIRDGKYIANEDDPKRVAKVGPKIEIKDWANIALCDRLARPLLSDLMKIYHEDDAKKIYAISLLRVCNPGAKDYELQEMYETSFLSELYPNVALSKNTVSTFEKNLGKEYSRIVRFMRLRTEAIGADAHILIDGTLKSNESRINSLSDFSRKAKTKGTRDISVLYAFDLDVMEPVCSKCYPGNMLDVTSVEDFISENHVTKGLMVSDKGFPSSATESYRSKNPNLHYLNPIKRNAKFIKTHDLHAYEEVLSGRPGVTCKKSKVQGKEKWLYAFRDAYLAGKEEKAYLEAVEREGKYDHADYLAKRESFGTIVLECDLDLTPETAYKAYEERWEIEIVMRYYKEACEFDETRVHSDYSVIGSEFCDFLATVMTFRLIKAFDRAELLKKRNYSRIMLLLRRAKKARIGDGGWNLICVNPSIADMLRNLDLLENLPSEPKRRGRPPKSVQIDIHD